VPDPMPADALAIARSLRVEDNPEARRLAEQNRAGMPCRSPRFRRRFASQRVSFETPGQPYEINSLKEVS